jgi:hypothetical protein
MITDTADAPLMIHGLGGAVEISANGGRVGITAPTVELEPAQVAELVSALVRASHARITWDEDGNAHRLLPT